MSTTLHTPSHPSASQNDFFSFHPYSQDIQSLSPSHGPNATPPRKQPLLLTPSPLRRHTDCEFDFDSAMQLDFDDFSAATGISTPFHPSAKFTSSPRRAPRGRSENVPPPFFKSPNPPPIEDEEGLFLRTNAGNMSMPLRTPERFAFDAVNVPNSVSNPNFSNAPKRKNNRLPPSPSKKQVLTPLHIHTAETGESLKRFATLAPLPAPRFLHNRRSVGNSMGRQVDTLQEMSISDRSMEMDTEFSSDEEFSNLKIRRAPKRPAPSNDSGAKGTADAISPDGHVSKRRTRSRPASLELIKSPSPRNSPKPKGRAFHRRNGSNTSGSTDTGSPPKMTKAPVRPGADRRLASSATLFFGPAIPQPGEEKVTRPNMERGSSSTLPPSTPVKGDDDPFDVVSPDNSFTNAFPRPADTSISFNFSLASEAPSPRNRIQTKFRKPRDSGVVLSDDEVENLLEPVMEPSKPTRPDSLRRLHARASTFPQPTVTCPASSEKTLCDESYVTPSHEKSRESSWLNQTETSTVDEFIVKTLETGAKDGATADEKRPPGTPQKRTKTAFLGIPVHRPWQSAAVNKMDRSPLFDERLPGPNFGSIMDSGGSAGDLSVPKRGLGNNGKPRKSCPGDLRFPSDSERITFASTALRSAESNASDNETSPTDARLINPRNRIYGDVGMGRPGPKLTPSQYFLRRSSSGAFSSVSEGSEGSVSGTPTKGTPVKRNISNEFRMPMFPLKPQSKPLTLTPLSSKSPVLNDASSGIRHSVRSQLPIFGRKMKENRRPEPKQNAVGSRSGISEKVPSINFATPARPSKTRQPGRQSGASGNFANPLFISTRARDELGRFEREFVEVDKIGSGEFGSALKVRYKDEYKDDRVYAVKKSKRYEGSRHRFRLREEVEILQHLSARAGPGFHPNVLGYVDSWEQDDQLYILTELCDFGNFAHFLNEYGRHFNRLEEAKVWKIFADISSGLRFIHSANVAHFDLKPANVFITAEGRFKIGDFGMASLWPRPPPEDDSSVIEENEISHYIGFEREGDKMYLAAEVLQGKYGKETDIFSFGMMMLETATNIYVPTQGDQWHKLREHDFSLVDGFTECSGSLQQLIANMMNKDPLARPTAAGVYKHDVVARARVYMDSLLGELRAQGETRPDILFKASPLAGVDDSFLSDILGVYAYADTIAMDCDA